MKWKTKLFPFFYKHTHKYTFFLVAIFLFFLVSFQINFAFKLSICHRLKIFGDILTPEKETPLFEKKKQHPKLKLNISDNCMAASSCFDAINNPTSENPIENLCYFVAWCCLLSHIINYTFLLLVSYFYCCFMLFQFALPLKKILKNI